MHALAPAVMLLSPRLREVRVSGSDHPKHAVDVTSMYRRYGGMVLRRIRRFYRGEEAEEVLQEVFMKVLTTRSTFQGDSSPSTWLYALTTRHCLNRLRDSKRRSELLAQHGEPSWSATRTEPNAEARIFLDELWSQLDDDLAMIAVYHYVDGMPHHEIARVMGVSRRTIGNRLADLTSLAARAADKTGEH